MVLPEVNQSVAIADFDIELVVLVPERRRAFHLDPMRAVVFDSCRSGHTVSDLVHDLVVATEWSIGDTEEWVRTVLGEFKAANVVDAGWEWVSFESDR
jgi:hypothetical protein